MLLIRDLQFTWPGAAAQTLALAELSVPAGGTLFLHGPSGCGKSTLLALMAGVLVAGRGSVSLLGQDWAALRPARRDARRADHVGVIFQQFNLLPYLSVLDNVLLPTRFSRRREQRCEGGAGASARSLLQQVGLHAPLWPRAARELSVGQQQRVAAARALIGAPELVIADEPTSALDAALRDEFMALLLGACRERGSTLVFVSHDERLAAQFHTRLDLRALNRVPLATDSIAASTASPA
jgi:putative ABC transport system ATP-binding protein